MNQQQRGAIAQQNGQRLALEVCRSRAGYYLGTLDQNGAPNSRESAEYWQDEHSAMQALTSGDWTQRTQP